MRRQTPFERDFADLHGPGALRHVRVEIVQEMPAAAPNRVAFGLVLGTLSLFWVIVLGVVVIAMAVVGWAMISALLGV